MIQKNDSIELDITDISSDGNGVGRYDNMAVFVAGAAPGDRLLVKIAKLRSRYAYGILQRIIVPSPVRAASDCPWFAQCGGCDFRHIQYSAELLYKQKFVADALRRLGNIDIDVLPCVASPEQDGYRNKVLFPVGERGGALVAGLFAPRSHTILPQTIDCRLQPANLNQIAAASCELLTRRGVSAYSEKTRAGLLRHILVRRSGKDGGVMLGLVVNGASLPDEPGFCAEITRRFPEIQTIVLNQNTQPGNVALGRANRTLFGSGFLSDEICGVSARLSPNSFFQINAPAAALLYEQVARYAGLKPGETLLDLYCGVGSIGLSVIDESSRLIGAETLRPAVEDARRNAREMGLGANSRFLCADAAQAAQQLLSERAAVDCVVTDPPRKGCDSATLAAILKIAPPRIVMVSCNPATLARDLKALVAGGYAPKKVQPFDLFPRTRHVEVVCLLEKEIREF